ncbi:MAG: hypothetical protein KBA33_03970 [Cloacibacterium sp.]|nr:hypothetical protein [Cloacibacterium sp.]
MSDSKYYMPSGKFGVSAVFLALVCAVTLIPLLGFLYAISCAEVPYVVLKWIFPILFAALVGTVINFSIIIYGKTRNGTVGFLLASILSFWAYFLHWIFFFVYLSSQNRAVNFASLISKEGEGFFQQAIFLVKNPFLVFDLINKYCGIGLWSFLGITWNGNLLVIFLIIEFLLILAISSFIGFVSYDKPFDELNNTWFKEDSVNIEKYFLPEENIVSKLEKQDYKGILEPYQSLNSQSQILGYSRHTIYSSGNTYYLSIENMEQKIDNGKTTHTSHSLVKYIQISSVFASEIRSKNNSIPNKI